MGLSRLFWVIVAVFLAQFATGMGYAASDAGFYKITSEADMAKALGRAIPETVQLVVLGEEIHASKGFYEYKSDVVKYLVKQRGFSRLAFEDNVLPVAKINTYLQTGQGDLSKLMKSDLYRVWKSKTLLELFRWLRAHNAKVKNPKDNVVLYGFDVQSPDVDQGLKKGKGLLRISQVLQRCLAGKANAKEQDICSGALDDQEKVLLKQRDELFLRDNIESLKSYIRIENAPDKATKKNLREQGMANLIMLNMASCSGCKTIVWTANGHGMKLSKPGSANMGQILSAKYQDKARFFHTVAKTIEVPKFWQKYKSKQPNGLATWLATKKHKRSFMDLRLVPRSEFGLDDKNPMTPYSFIDGVFYLERSPAMDEIK